MVRFNQFSLLQDQHEQARNLVELLDHVVELSAYALNDDQHVAADKHLEHRLLSSNSDFLQHQGDNPTSILLAALSRIVHVSFQEALSGLSRMNRVFQHRKDSLQCDTEFKFYTL